VKVLKDGIDLGDEQFEKEYHNLASLHHKNVVRLVGYCHETKKECMPYNGRMVFAEKTKRVLCFEYMHNGSLGNFIYSMICGTLLVLGGSNLRNNLTHTLMMILFFSLQINLIDIIGVHAMR
jgi:serine/threonine protein kinase